MDKKIMNLLKKLMNVYLTIIDNINEQNVDKIVKAVNNFEKNINGILRPTKTSTGKSSEKPIWTKFPEMTEEEIRKEFMNVEKYPTIESIKEAVRGYIDLQKVSKVKTRETLIKHIIDTYKRSKFITEIGRE